MNFRDTFLSQHYFHKVTQNASGYRSFSFEFNNNLKVKQIMRAKAGVMIAVKELK